MKRLLKNKITSSNAIYENDYCFTPSEVVELLLEIEELKGLPVKAVKSPNGGLQFVVGTSMYQIVNDGMTPNAATTK